MKNLCLFFLSVLILAGCSSSKRFSEDIESDAITNVRLLIDESPNEKELSIKSDCFLFEEEKEIGKIFSGEKIFIKSHPSNKGIVTISMMGI